MHDAPRAPREAGRPLGDSAGSGFQTTQWSLVVAAGSDGPQRTAALEHLCRVYWRPVYGFIRSLGQAPEPAKDLTQAFFAHLLDHNIVAAADPERGRFRAYLRTACRLFLGNEWQKRTAQKRGGGALAVPWHTLTNEDETAFTHPTDPARDFDRQWTLALLRGALARLEAEQGADPAAVAQFERLKPFLTQRPGPGDYERLAADLGVARGTVPVLVHRLGKRYQELIRAEVAATLVDRADVDAELRHCLQSLD